MSQCEYCFELIDKDIIDEHMMICYKEQTELLNSCENRIKVVEDKPQISNTQIKAIEYCFKKSKLFSKNVYKNLLARFQFKGHTKNDLNQVVKFIKKNIRIIIHVNLDSCLQYLIKDDHYRNQFETNRSHGTLSSSARMVWENNLFNNIYHKDIDGGERVKYGTINITNDPLGVTKCYGYGDSYLILKDNVKTRCSFIMGDSCAMDIHLCTFKYFNSILLFLKDEALDDVIDVSLGKATSRSSNSLHHYIEAQIHGPIKLSRDVELLVANSKYRNNIGMINNLHLFSMNHGVSYKFNDEL